MEKLQQELKELKVKLRNCDLTQFKNHDEYLQYAKKLAYEFAVTHKQLTTEQLKNLLEEVK